MLPSARLLTSALSLWLPPHVGGVFFVANGGAHDLAMGKMIVKPGGFKELQKGPKKPKFKIEYNGVKHAIQLAEGTAGKHTGLVVDGEGGCRAVDTNDLQTELARSALGCPQMDFGCVAGKTLGGIAPADFTKRMFLDTWVNYDFWSLCVPQEPEPAVRTERTRTGHDLEVIREFPMVATVRGFASEAECQELVGSANMRQLTMAHVGSGGGSTSTSDARETLTSSLHVNWNVEDTLSRVAARTFDLSSDILGVDVPYEGQEPINFLHYLKGYEYRPHHDGSKGAGRHTPPPTGTRIGTTLIYCEAADEGGATVFTHGKAIKFQPGRGDILFFAYNPDPKHEAMHAACPVLEGNKTTLTQWHRLGVSDKVEWDSFENWGKFHNPHQGTKWKGSRFSNHDKAEL